jgi:hypothetical protein
MATTLAVGVPGWQLSNTPGVPLNTQQANRTKIISRLTNISAKRF